MIDARTQVARAMPDQELAQDVEKWSKEIVALDAENQAGLKSKYEVRVLLLEAQTLLRTQKLAEAHAALDKALAVTSLAGEQLQEVQLTKGTCYAAQQEFQKCLESCQKALDAAPDSPRVRMVTSLMRRAEGELAKQKAKDQPKTDEPKPAAS